jgi:hypothetical protein
MVRPPDLLEKDFLLIKKIARAAPPGDYFGQLRHRPLGEWQHIAVAFLGA